MPARAAAKAFAAAASRAAPNAAPATSAPDAFSDWLGRALGLPPSQASSLLLAAILLAAIVLPQFLCTARAASPEALAAAEAKARAARNRAHERIGRVIASAKQRAEGAGTSALHAVLSAATAGGIDAVGKRVRPRALSVSSSSSPSSSSDSEGELPPPRVLRGVGVGAALTASEGTATTDGLRSRAAARA
jgi:hypothetical protein